MSESLETIPDTSNAMTGADRQARPFPNSPADLFWPPAFDAVIFDFDGTIADSGDIWRQVDRIFLAERGLTYTPDYSLAMAALGFGEGAEYTIEHFGLDEDPQDICNEWNRMGAELYRDSVNLRPGAQAYIERLRRLGVPVALATTNDESVLASMVPRVRVDELFDTCVHRAEVARSKHFPDIYLEAARRLGADPARCLVFEDITPGVLSSQAAGMTACGVWSNDPAQDPEELHGAARLWLNDWRDLL